jgi:tripartite-type tricarboxylate transporter receptor subunit TctC
LLPPAGAPGAPVIGEVVPEFQSPPYWIGFFGPAKLPEPVLRRLNAEIVRVLDTPEMRTKWAEAGFVVAPSSPEAFTRKMYDDLERIGRITRGAGIKPE